MVEAHTGEVQAWKTFEFALIAADESVSKLSRLLHLWAEWTICRKGIEADDETVGYSFECQFTHAEPRRPKEIRRQQERGGCLLRYASGESYVHGARLLGERGGVCV